MEVEFISKDREVLRMIKIKFNNTKSRLLRQEN